jgi:hypothetical protein
MKIERPKKWKIEIWEEDGKWHETYIELFPDTEKNREAMKTTVVVIETVMKNAGFTDCIVKGIEMDGMIGLSIVLTSKYLATIANQLLSEFVIMSEIGDITLRDMFVVLIQSFMHKSLFDEEIKRMKKDDTKKIV